MTSALVRPGQSQGSLRSLVRPLLPIACSLAFAGCYVDPEDPRDPTDSNASAEGTTTTGGEMGDVIEILPENMIDDLEDCDDAIIEQGGRGGSWYSYNDASGGTQSPSGTQSPANGGIEGSDMCHAMTMGGGFSEWGSGVGFDFVNDGTTKMPWDGSAHTGVVFWARGSVTDLRVNLLVPEVLAETEGGECVPSSPETDDCSDAHGMMIALTDEWQQFQVPFASITQGGWGQPVAFDPAKLMSMHWYIPQDQDFELFIDDIGFY